MVSGTGLPWDGYAGAVQSGPEDADGVVEAGGKVVEVIGALPALEDAEIVAEPWEWHSPRDAPLPGGGGVLSGAGGDGECGDEPAVFMDAEDSLPETDGNMPCLRRRGRGKPVGGGIGVVVEWV